MPVTEIFWQRCGHYRYAYRRYSLGNIRKISGYIIISSDFYLNFDPYVYLGCRDLNFTRDTPPHNSENLCQVILKSLYAYRNFALNKRFSMTSKSDIDLWPRGLVDAHNMASYFGEYLYEVSLESLHLCRRYALDRIFIFYHHKWHWQSSLVTLTLHILT
jgi:hypothetical protein